MDNYINNLRISDPWAKIIDLDKIKSVIHSRGLEESQVAPLLISISSAITSNNITLSRSAISAILVVLVYLQKSFDSAVIRATSRPILSSLFSIGKFLGNSDEPIRSLCALVLQHIFSLVPISANESTFSNWISECLRSSSKWRTKEQILVGIGEACMRIGPSFVSAISTSHINEMINLLNDSSGAVRDASVSTIQIFCKFNPILLKQQLSAAKLRPSQMELFTESLDWVHATGPPMSAGGHASPYAHHHLPQTPQPPQIELITSPQYTESMAMFDECHASQVDSKNNHLATTTNPISLPKNRILLSNATSIIEQITPLAVDSESELRQKIQMIQEKLTNCNRNNWQEKVILMKQMQALVLGNVDRIKSSISMLKPLQICLCKLLTEIRVAVIDETTRFLIVLGYLFKESVSGFVEQLLPALFKTLDSTNQVLADYGDRCIQSLLSYSQPSCLSLFFDKASNAKRAQTRIKSITYITMILEEMPLTYYEKYEVNIEATIKKTVSDINQLARTNARKSFRAFSKIWPSRAMALLETIESSTAVNLLKKECMIQDTTTSVTSKSIIQERNHNSLTASKLSIASSLTSNSLPNIQLAMDELSEISIDIDNISLKSTLPLSSNSSSINLVKKSSAASRLEKHLNRSNSTPTASNAINANTINVNGGNCNNTSNYPTNLIPPNSSIVSFNLGLNATQRQQTLHSQHQYQSQNHTYNPHQQQVATHSAQRVLTGHTSAASLFPSSTSSRIRAPVQPSTVHKSGSSSTENNIVSLPLQSGSAVRITAAVAPPVRALRIISSASSIDLSSTSSGSQPISHNTSASTSSQLRHSHSSASHSSSSSSRSEDLSALNKMLKLCRSSQHEERSKAIIQLSSFMKTDSFAAIQTSAPTSSKLISTLEAALRDPQLRVVMGAIDCIKSLVNHELIDSHLDRLIPLLFLVAYESSKREDVRLLAQSLLSQLASPKLSIKMIELALKSLESNDVLIRSCAIRSLAPLLNGLVFSSYEKSKLNIHFVLVKLFRHIKSINSLDMVVVIDLLQILYKNYPETFLHEIYTIPFPEKPELLKKLKLPIPQTSPSLKKSSKSSLFGDHLSSANMESMSIGVNRGREPINTHRKLLRNNSLREIRSKIIHQEANPIVKVGKTEKMAKTLPKPSPSLSNGHSLESPADCPINCQSLELDTSSLDSDTTFIPEYNKGNIHLEDSSHHVDQSHKDVHYLSNIELLHAVSSSSHINALVDHIGTSFSPKMSIALTPRRANAFRAQISSTPNVLATVMDNPNIVSPLSPNCDHESTPIVDQLHRRWSLMQQLQTKYSHAKHLIRHTTNSKSLKGGVTILAKPSDDQEYQYNYKSLLNKKDHRSPNHRENSFDTHHSPGHRLSPIKFRLDTYCDSKKNENEDPSPKSEQSSPSSPLELSRPSDRDLDTLETDQTPINDNSSHLMPMDLTNDESTTRCSYLSSIGDILNQLSDLTNIDVENHLVLLDQLANETKLVSKEQLLCSLDKLNVINVLQLLIDSESIRHQIPTTVRHRAVLMLVTMHRRLEVAFEPYLNQLPPADKKLISLYYTRQFIDPESAQHEEITL